MGRTYRERRLERAERLREWAGKREAQSDALAASSHALLDVIPFGQPILVGHHSERADRSRRDRAWNQMGAAVENGRKAERMASSADEIERQADRAIYDDDHDAIERLTAKLAGLEAERDAVKAKRAEIRKAGGAKLRAMGGWDREEVMRAAGAAQYRVTNLGGQITSARQRLARLQREKVSGPRDRLISARFASSCEDCGASIAKGDTIRYNRQQGARCAPDCQSEEG